MRQIRRGRLSLSPVHRSCPRSPTLGSKSNSSNPYHRRRDSELPDVGHALLLFEGAGHAGQPEAGGRNARHKNRRERWRARIRPWTTPPALILLLP